MAKRCPSITSEGNPCQGRVPSGRTYCLSHDPERREAQREASRKGGEARANARRAAKQWAAFGREMGDDDLASVLKSCMFAVRDGTMTPAEANAIATLARTAITITNELELVQRIEALEEAAGLAPASIRRIG